MKTVMQSVRLLFSQNFNSIRWTSFLYPGTHTQPWSRNFPMKHQARVCFWTVVGNSYPQVVFSALPTLLHIKPHLQKYCDPFFLFDFCRWWNGHGEWLCHLQKIAGKQPKSAGAPSSGHTLCLFWPLFVLLDFWELWERNRGLKKGIRDLKKQKRCFSKEHSL